MHRSVCPLPPPCHQYLPVSFSCPQSLRNCYSPICPAWADWDITLSTSNDPKIQGTGPISSQTCLKRIGLRGHRFQNLDGKDDPLFLEEGKGEKIKVSVIISLLHHNGITFSWAQILSWIWLLPKYTTLLHCNLCVTLINSACCSSPSALLTL